MSRFFSSKYASLVPYVPGEQPRDRKYVKLNTNESPFSPSPAVIRAVLEEAASLQLYSDPEASILISKLAETYDVEPERIIATNGSDEVLDFAFNAFCDNAHPIVFPDLTYGFYSVFADKLSIPYEEIPLKDDFTIDVNDYIGINKNIVIANPNAPTGIALPLSDIERIVASNPDNVVIIDEAYVDFGGESAIKLTERYGNLLVVQTFSKSRSLAGGRLGYALASAEIIADLNRIKYSTNPYNINRMTLASAEATLAHDEVCAARCAEIAATRTYTAAELQKLGFTLTDSKTNFLFARPANGDAATMYAELRKRGILVRYFSGARVREYLRITVGTREQMDALLCAVREILG